MCGAAAGAALIFLGADPPQNSARRKLPVIKREPGTARGVAGVARGVIDGKGRKTSATTFSSC